jgi:hypothetical protein
MNLLFIYENEKEVKVLTNEQALVKHSELIENGFNHKATINPVIALENIYNRKKKQKQKVKNMDYKIVNVNYKSKVVHLYVNFDEYPYQIGEATKIPSGRYYVKFDLSQFFFLMKHILKSKGEQNTKQVLESILHILESISHDKYKRYFNQGTIKDNLKEAKKALADFIQSEPMLDLKKCLD